MVLRGAPLRRVDEHARRDRRHVVQWLALRGERWTQERGGLHVVEPDNRKVFGDAQPVLPGGLIYAHRLQVAAGEDRGGAVRVLERSSGMRSRFCRAASYTPIACRSLPAKIAVGRFGFSSKAIACA